MTVRYDERTALQSLVANDSSNHMAESDHIESYSKVLSLTKYLQIGLILLFFIIGSIAAPMAFRTGSDQQLNIFWLLIVLLGTHFLSLFLWLLSQLRQSAQTAHAPAWFSVLLNKLGRLFGLSEQTLSYFIQLRFSGAVGIWHIGRIVHSAWTGYLVGGLLSALLFLMTHQVQFIWETTLLTQTDFRTLTQAISVVPAWLGVAPPSLDDIAWSQIGNLTQPDDTRKTWAVWILSCVLIYGVMVRGLFVILCHLFYRQQRNKLWRSFIPTSRPDSQTHREILDAEQISVVQASAADAKVPAPKTAIIQTSQPVHYFLFEWSRGIPPALEQAEHLSTLNDSQAQQHFLETHQDGRIIVIDAEVSPDRGSLRFMGQAQPLTNQFYVCGDGFVEAWTQALLERGIEPRQIARLSDNHQG
ncbi:DUF2868 domain-containing protein [Marinomonas fungiae]|uniref:DUF2868 domain-containing protein n=1 Tax=Marinomonas fungiae TaxID=1137284 RepID=A0A0K6ISD0_9GAMM|nr:DUF2868 domain-containing protein [Marinomonas fungiae]CUB06222.1 Protein of unknown function (DUF2868) [Marinomonas fungiae]